MSDQVNTAELSTAAAMSTKKDERDALNADIEAFLARGGKIQKVDGIKKRTNEEIIALHNKAAVATKLDKKTEKPKAAKAAEKQQPPVAVVAEVTPDPKPIKDHKEPKEMGRKCNPVWADREGYLEVMKNNKITVEQIWPKSGVCRSFFQKVMAGRANPTPAVAKAIETAITEAVSEKINNATNVAADNQLEKQLLKVSKGINESIKKIKACAKEVSKEMSKQIEQATGQAKEELTDQQQPPVASDQQNTQWQTSHVPYMQPVSDDPKPEKANVILSESQSVKDQMIRALLTEVNDLQSSVPAGYERTAAVTDLLDRIEKLNSTVVIIPKIIPDAGTTPKYTPSKGVKIRPEWVNREATRQNMITHSITQLSVKKILGFSDGLLGQYLTGKVKPLPEVAISIEQTVDRLIADRQQQSV